MLIVNPNGGLSSSDMRCLHDIFMRFAAVSSDFVADAHIEILSKGPDGFSLMPYSSLDYTGHKYDPIAFIEKFGSGQGSHIFLTYYPLSFAWHNPGSQPNRQGALFQAWVERDIDKDDGNRLRVVARREHIDLNELKSQITSSLPDLVIEHS